MGPARNTAPLRARNQPRTPAANAHAVITPSSAATGQTSEPTDRLGREPARATTANVTPRSSPTHHVAMNPQPRPSRVGSAVPKIEGWPTVKYSTQTRAVTWSWAMPYSTAATTHIKTMPNDRTSVEPPTRNQPLSTLANRQGKAGEHLQSAINCSSANRIDRPFLECFPAKDRGKPLGLRQRKRCSVEPT